RGDACRGPHDTVFAEAGAGAGVVARASPDALSGRSCLPPSPPAPKLRRFGRFATPPPHCLRRNKSLNGLHNPVTLHVVCQYMLLRSVHWRPGALLERTCLARQLAGVGAECGLPAAELLPAVFVVVAGRDQGGVPRSRQ